MREKILGILLEKAPASVSGEELAIGLGISRTAVWKHIKALQGMGYMIKSVTGKGYVLEEVPDKLLTLEINRFLQTKWLGRKIQSQEEVGSTNEVAKALAHSGIGHGLVCVAETQTGGKGRLSRGWFSPSGSGVWFSVVLQPKFLPEEASKCTLLAAVAVVEAVNSYPGVHAVIKWPNDILLEGKKLVGILTEMSAEFGHINYIVIGVGINVAIPRELIPEDLRDTAISLQDVCGEKVNRAELLAKVLLNMENLYEEVEKQGFAPVLEAWRKNSGTLGKQVKVIAPDMTYEGEAVDIDKDGMLLVRKADGSLEKVVAGDVSIRPVKPTRSKYE